MRADTARSLTAAEALPAFDARERHTRRVEAPSERALAAALGVTPAEAPLLRVLFRLRGLSVNERPIWEHLVAVGFRRESHTLLVGVGRPWSVGGGMLAVADFAGFREPGWAKLALDVGVEDGRLVTETRVLCTDGRSRRRFRAYWLVIRPFSGLVRRSWLRAAKRRAERAGG
jgi:hypothetical protein